MRRFKTRADKQAAIALPIILVASVFMGNDAHAHHGDTSVPSTYPVPSHYAQVEECIRMRESNSHWDSRNKGRNHLGAYQMTQALANGATYWMLKRGDLARYLGTGNRSKQRILARQLRATSVHKWEPWLQTAAFVRTMDGHHKNQPWSGLHHWNGGRWHCGR